MDVSLLAVFHLKPENPELFTPPNFLVFTADISNTGWYGFPLHPKEKVVKVALHSEGLELHPVTILLALAFWGLLWGVVGMVLAVPMTATIRIVLMRFETTRPIGQLLAGNLPEDPAAG